MTRLVVSLSSQRQMVIIAFVLPLLSGDGNCNCLSVPSKLVVSGYALDFVHYSVVSLSEIMVLCFRLNHFPFYSSLGKGNLSNHSVSCLEIQVVQVTP